MSESPLRKNDRSPWMLRASHTTGGVGSLGGRRLRPSLFLEPARTEPRPPEYRPISRSSQRSKGSAARYASVPDRMRARREARPPERPPRASECLRKGEVAAEPLPHPGSPGGSPSRESPCRIPARREADDPISRPEGADASASSAGSLESSIPRACWRRHAGQRPRGRRRATPGRSSGSARDRPCRHSGDATGPGSDILYAIAARTLQPGLSFDRRWILDYPLG